LTVTVDHRARPPHILVLGRQGSGKGVQCARLATALGLDHLSTGDALRAAVAEDTALGRTVEPFLLAGSLVPDDLVVGLVAERIALADAEGVGVVLDGFPRTVHQAARLEELLAPDRIDLAIHLDVPRTVAIARLTSRQRADDNPEAIGRRMSEHAQAQGPLLSWLDARDVLVHIDGNRPADLVAADVAAVVATRVLVT
jgi:adenylate kinase